MNIKFDEKEILKIVMYARTWNISENDATRRMIREFVSKDKEVDE